jgi:hypothetical protein
MAGIAWSFEKLTSFVYTIVDTILSTPPISSPKQPTTLPKTIQDPHLTIQAPARLRRLSRCGGTINQPERRKAHHSIHPLAFDQSYLFGAQP